MRGPPQSKSVTAYEYLSIIATYGYLALIYHGIRTMERTCEKNYGDSERKHAEFMARHDEAMAESERRHDEFMTESKRRHDEAMADIQRRKEEAMSRRL